MIDERRSYKLTANGREWTFTQEAGDALKGAPGMTVFVVAVGSTLKTGTAEINFKGYGLFQVTRRGTKIRVSLIEGEAE